MSIFRLRSTVVAFNAFMRLCVEKMFLDILIVVARIHVLIKTKWNMPGHRESEEKIRTKRQKRKGKKQQQPNERVQCTQCTQHDKNNNIKKRTICAATRPKNDKNVEKVTQTIHSRTFHATDRPHVTREILPLFLFSFVFLRMLKCLVSVLANDNNVIE